MAVQITLLICILSANLFAPPTITATVLPKVASAPKAVTITVKVAEEIDPEGLVVSVAMGNARGYGRSTLRTLGPDQHMFQVVWDRIPAGEYQVVVAVFREEKQIGSVVSEFRRH